MANDTVITVIGNLTADPELRFTQSGVAVASFTIASTPRKFNRQTNEWEDEEAIFMRCSIWRDAAENVSESLEKGTRVVAQGRLKQRSFQDRDGNNRTVMELDVDEVGPSLKYAVAKPQKIDRRQQGGFQGAPQGNVPGYPQQGYAPQQGGPQGNPWGGGQQAPQQAPQGAPQGQWGGQPQGQPQQSPWAGQGGEQQQIPQGGAYNDPPPF